MYQVLSKGRRSTAVYQVPSKGRRSTIGVLRVASMNIKSEILQTLQNKCLRRIS